MTVPGISRATRLGGALVACLLVLLSTSLVALRWQLSPPPPYTVDLGNPDTAASHFYGVEESGSRRFRWSRTLSAVSLPALASRQVISVTVNPGRPDPAESVTFHLFDGDRPLATHQAMPGWNTYTATVGTRFSPDVRLVIESDTFYPGIEDRRRLGLAVSSIDASPVQGRTGLVLPPFLWIVLSAIVPLLPLFGFGDRHPRVRYALALASTVLPPLISVLLPTAMALPLFAWLVGLSTAAAIFWRIAIAERAGLFLLLRRMVPQSRHSEVAGVGLLALVLAVIMTWPLASRLGTDMPGWPADNFAFLYKLWWFRTALFDLGVSPLFDPNSYAPFGFNLGQGEPTLLNTLPGSLIGTLSSDVIAYNLLALASFVVSAVGGYLLVRELTGLRSAALLGGIAFAFCPYRMSQFAGHLQLLGTGWIALTFYFAERALRTHRARDGAFAGLNLALAALSAWYYAYMVGLVLALYIVVRAIQLGSFRSLMRPLLAATVTLVVVAGPAALPSLLLWRSGELSHSAKAADEHSAALADYLVPNQLHPVWGETGMRAHANQNVIESSLYLGLVPLSIIALGLLSARRSLSITMKRLWRAWVAVFAISAVLSLGLFLHDGSGQVRVALSGGTAPVPMPGSILYDWLPFYSSMRAFARFGVLTALATAALMGLAWRAILHRNQTTFNRYGVTTTVAVFSLLLFDFWTAPYSWGTSQVSPTPVTSFLAQAPPGTVMQMPFESTKHGLPLWRATYYNKPVSYGYDTFEPAAFRAARPLLEDFPSDASLRLLSGWGVRYIVVSANAYGAEWAGTSAYLQSLPKLRHLGDFAEPRHWSVDPGVLDARPDLIEYAVPDTLAVFELQP